MDTATGEWKTEDTSAYDTAWVEPEYKEDGTIEFEYEEGEADYNPETGTYDYKDPNEGSWWGGDTTTDTSTDTGGSWWGGGDEVPPETGPGTDPNIPPHEQQEGGYYDEEKGEFIPDDTSLYGPTDGTNWLEEKNNHWAKTRTMDAGYAHEQSFWWQDAMW